MSIGMLIDNPGGSRELYERLLATMDVHPPLGGIAHLAGPGPQGGWRVIEVWESEEQAKAFVTERFKPALRAVGFEGTPPVPQFWTIEAVELAPSGHAAAGSST